MVINRIYTLHNYMSNRTQIMSHREYFNSMVGWTSATPTQMNPIYGLSINRQTVLEPNNQNYYQDKSHYHKKYEMNFRCHPCAGSKKPTGAC